MKRFESLRILVSAALVPAIAALAAACASDAAKESTAAPSEPAPAIVAQAAMPPVYPPADEHGVSHVHPIRVTAEVAPLAAAVAPAANDGDKR